MKISNTSEENTTYCTKCSSTINSTNALEPEDVSRHTICQTCFSIAEAAFLEEEAERERQYAIQQREEDLYQEQCNRNQILMDDTSEGEDPFSDDDC